MLRADNVGCGTSSTGTGTLTLAACPRPPGGLDFDKWLKATGYNFVSTNAVLVSYTIIEYTDATLATAKQTEKGIGTLTLGASITAATLARTTVQSTVTGLDTSTPSPSFSAPTAITIGTAANTEVHVGASVMDLLPSFPYVGLGSLGVQGLGTIAAGTVTTLTPIPTGSVCYLPFYFPTTMLVKKFYSASGAGYSGVASNVYAAIYDVNSSGKPGKLLIDFGVLGTAGSSLSGAFTNINSALHASGFLLTPGVYFAAVFVAYTAGGTGTANMTGAAQGGLGQYVFGQDNAFNIPVWALDSVTANPAPDPATTTGGYSIQKSTSPGTSQNFPIFSLAPS